MGPSPSPEKIQGTGLTLDATSAAWVSPGSSPREGGGPAGHTCRGEHEDGHSLAQSPGQVRLQVGVTSPWTLFSVVRAAQGPCTLPFQKLLPCSSVLLPPHVTFPPVSSQLKDAAAC